MLRKETVMKLDITTYSVKDTTLVSNTRTLRIPENIIKPELVDVFTNDMNARTTNISCSQLANIVNKADEAVVLGTLTSVERDEIGASCLERSVEHLASAGFADIQQAENSIDSDNTLAELALGFFGIVSNDDAKKIAERIYTRLATIGLNQMDSNDRDYLRNQMERFFRIFLDCPYSVAKRIRVNTTMVNTLYRFYYRDTKATKSGKTKHVYQNIPSIYKWLCRMGFNYIHSGEWTDTDIE